MDERELQVRQVELYIAELHHQSGLRHSELQRRFLFALTLAAGVFLSLLRAEVPLWAVLAAVPPLMSAVRDVMAIRRLSKETHAEVVGAIGSLGRAPPPKGSRPEEANDP